jgi:tetratricopeptide (TPR) repeat protein
LVAPTSATGRARIISFVARVSGTGRTSVVANVACLLAAAGNRVLAVDWGSDEPRIDDYFKPFLIGELPADQTLPEDLDRLLAPMAEPVRVASRVVRVRAAATLVSRRHRLPGGGGVVDIIGYADRGASFSTAPIEDEGAGVELARPLRTVDYDYVLIDCPSGLSDTALRQVALLSDTVAVCFLPRDREIRTAAGIARTLRQSSPADRRILAVPTHANTGDERWVREKRGLIHRTFAPALLAAGQPDAAVEGSVVEVPYQPYDAHEDVLAVLIDDPVRAGSLSSAYERLTRALAGGADARPLSVGAVARTRYRRALGIDPAGAPIAVAHAAHDRPWADWIIMQLRLARARPERLTSWDAWSRAEPRPALLVVESERLTTAETEDRLDRLDTGDAADGAVGARGDVVHVVVGAASEPGGGVAGNVVDLTQLDEEEARMQLLAQFALVSARPDAPSESAPRFPRRTPAVMDMPARNPDFVGREADLDRLRELLIRPGGTRLAVSGLLGVGKSELVREYAHRFAADYDLIWWVPAHSRQAARRSLGRLAARTDADLAPGVAGDAVSPALRQLAADQPSPRWLLIYDNLDDVQLLPDLMPPGGRGDVLVTTRVRGPLAVPAGPRIAGFDADDGVALLRHHVSAVSVPDARRLAEAVDHLPITLRLAAAWIRESMERIAARGVPVPVAAAGAVADLLDRLAEPADEATEAADEHSDRESVLARMLRATLDALRGTAEGRLAIRLIEVCALLAPSGVRLHLLRSAPMLRQLLAGTGDDGRTVLADAFEFDRVAWLCARYGLVEVHWGTDAYVRMHPAVQSLVCAELDRDARNERRHQVWRALAEYAPGDTDDGDEGRARLDELQRHLFPSGALDADDPDVRRWIVLQTRHLVRHGDVDSWAATLTLAEKLATRWGDRPDTADALWLRLRGHVADLHRLLGNDAQAHDIDEDVQARQRRLLGVGHLRTLVTGRGKAGDLRGLGEFYEARVEDFSTHALFVAALGEDHPDSLRAAHNLALSSYLMGDVRSAHRLARDVVDRRLRLDGPAHPLTWWSAGNLGVFLRELGRYDEALQLLSEVRDWISLAGRSARLVDELRVRREIAVVKRRTGDAVAAMDEDDRILRAYSDRLGPEHHNTWVCRASVAADQHALGDPAVAAELAGRCLANFADRLGPAHPFVGICRVNLAVYLSAAGRHDEALAAGLDAVDGLGERLDESHPWLLAARVNLVRFLLTTGRPDEAAARADAVHPDAQLGLGLDHPYTRAAAAARQLARTPADGIAGHDGAGIDIDIPQT